MPRRSACSHGHRFSGRPRHLRAAFGRGLPPRFGFFATARHRRQRRGLLARPRPATAPKTPKTLQQPAHKQKPTPVCWILWTWRGGRACALAADRSLALGNSLRLALLASASTTRTTRSLLGRSSAKRWSRRTARLAAASEPLANAQASSAAPRFARTTPTGARLAAAPSNGAKRWRAFWNASTKSAGTRSPGKWQSPPGIASAGDAAAAAHEARPSPHLRGPAALAAPLWERSAKRRS